MLRDMKPPLQVQLRRFDRKPNCKLVPMRWCYEIIRDERCDGYGTERDDETCECCKHCRYHYANQEEQHHE